MAVISIATVFVPGKGLAVGHLKSLPSGTVGRRDYWLEYTVNQNLWQSHWVEVPVPARGSLPQLLSLAVDDDHGLVATVAYGSGAIVAARLSVNPNWHVVKRPHLLETL